MDVDVPSKEKVRLKPRSPGEQRFTVRKPEWQHLHLRMTFDPPYPADHSSPSYPPDLLTWKTHLSEALNQFLGVSGMAIPVDFLHSADGAEVYIRIPREDSPRFMAGITGWGKEVEGRTVGFRVLGSTEFSMGLVGGDGTDLFR
ncbi:hypothetical protein H072_3745 [Dactylellina haptotyla CBS 200.50]|uniref:Ribonucleases P/MRP subunit Pop8-like domain-containing protein n=1 Tax=Dactylellina haptotyla (strain CBS 200.50) TaxID=1284197 RepID=S8AMG4_DACHA|nr:hypothetical protein H072_3745 [Dactylellina haptotyla CBS 200.50]